MGFSPVDVDRMSVWQLQAAMVGFAKLHAGTDETMAPAEADEVWEWMQQRPSSRTAYH